MKYRAYMQEDGTIHIINRYGEDIKPNEKGYYNLRDNNGRNTKVTTKKMRKMIERQEAGAGAAP